MKIMLLLLICCMFKLNLIKLSDVYIKKMSCDSEKKWYGVVGGIL